MWKFFERKKCKNNKTSTCFQILCKFLTCWSFNFFNTELQLKDTECAITNKLKKLLTEFREIKLVTLVFVFKKIESDDKRKYDKFYSHSKTQTIINESDTDDVFESVYTTVMSNIQKSLGKGSIWIIDSVIEHNINISKYNPLADRNCIKLPKQLDHPRKGLINI